jgi:hypothetical protein
MCIYKIMYFFKSSQKTRTRRSNNVSIYSLLFIFISYKDTCIFLHIKFIY